MPVRRDKKSGRWRYRQMVTLADGSKTRISGSAPKHNNTRAAAEAAMLEHIDRLVHPGRHPRPRREVPTFEEWFNGRFWREWVVARKNKPSEQGSKESIFRVHLKDVFGDCHLDEIDVGMIARFRADLIDAGKSDKTINNILAVLSKALRYAADVELIDRAPKVGLLKAERPEVEAWSLEEYARLIAAAREMEPRWLAAACLAGEAGLRIGEVRALDWRRDVDLVAGTLTVNRQSRKGKTGTPKGRTRRVVPMTPLLQQVLRSMPTIRTGFVARNDDGSALTDDQTKYNCYRLCRLAKLPDHGWHKLRHSFGTHAAMFSANPWKLMQWMGHKRIDETMRYVHFAEVHLRPWPETINEAARAIENPDAKIIAMLGARSSRGRKMPRPLGSLENHQRS